MTLTATANASATSVLITERFHVEALARLRVDSRFVLTTSLGRRPTAEELSSVEGLIIRSGTKVDADFLALAPKLKVVITATSGYDHIDLDVTSARGICVMHTPEANAQSAAELTWALVLGCARQLLPAYKSLKAGNWRSDLNGRELCGETYGVIGLGRIGQRVARMAQAFGMKVVAFDPYQSDEAFKSLGVARSSCEEVLKLAFVVSFHVPKTAETQQMLNASHFEYIRRGMILINTSRGSVINENDLCKALEQEFLGAVGLDVFATEPLPRHSPLFIFKNVLLTPHLGATTEAAFARASFEAAQKLSDFFARGARSDTLGLVKE